MLNGDHSCAPTNSVSNTLAASSVPTWAVLESSFLSGGSGRLERRDLKACPPEVPPKQFDPQQ